MSYRLLVRPDFALTCNEYGFINICTTQSTHVYTMRIDIENVNNIIYYTFAHEQHHVILKIGLWFDLTPFFFYYFFCYFMSPPIFSFDFFFHHIEMDVCAGVYAVCVACKSKLETFTVLLN